MMFAVHCTWVTSNAYSSPSIVLASYGHDGWGSIHILRPPLCLSVLCLMSVVPVMHCDGQNSKWQAKPMAFIVQPPFKFRSAVHWVFNSS
jgi:hypothetical protein